MEKALDILTFGDLCVDLIFSGGDVVPEFGQKEKIIGDYSLEMGGSCSIFACQTAKLGLRTAVLGKVGEDSFGELILGTLTQAGVSTQYVQKTSQYKTGITTALNTGSDRAMLTYNGTIDSLEREYIPEDLLTSVRHLHIGSYFLMKRIQPYYPEIIRKVKQAGGTISLDTNWDPEEKWDSGIQEILPLVDILFPNEQEAMAITRESSAEKAIERLKSIVPVVAVKLGDKGAAVYAEGQIYRAEAVPQEVADAVGAGDTFDGGFLYGFLTGRSIQECARMGCICGSLSTRCTGGVKGQPRLEELWAQNDTKGKDSSAGSE